MEKQPETIHILEIGCEESDKDAAKDLVELIGEFKDRFKLYNIRQATNEDVEETTSDTEAISNMDELQEALQKAMQVMQQHRWSRGRDNLVQNAMPSINEALFLQALDECNRTEILNLLKYSNNITHAILLKAAKMISAEQSPWGGIREFIVNAIINKRVENMIDDEILWYLIKSPLRGVHFKAIRLANTEMLDYLEDFYKDKTMAKVTKETIEVRRRQLKQKSIPNI